MEYYKISYLSQGKMLALCQAKDADCVVGNFSVHNFWSIALYSISYWAGLH